MTRDIGAWVALAALAVGGLFHLVRLAQAGNTMHAVMLGALVPAVAIGEWRAARKPQADPRTVADRMLLAVAIALLAAM